MRQTTIETESRKKETKNYAHAKTCANRRESNRTEHVHKPRDTKELNTIIVQSNTRSELKKGVLWDSFYTSPFSILTIDLSLFPSIFCCRVVVFFSLFKFRFVFLHNKTRLWAVAELFTTLQYIKTHSMAWHGMAWHSIAYWNVYNKTHIAHIYLIYFWYQDFCAIARGFFFTT